MSANRDGNGNGNGGAAATAAHGRRHRILPDDDLVGDHQRQVGVDIGGIKIEMAKIVTAHAARDAVIDKLYALEQENAEEIRAINRKLDRSGEVLTALAADVRAFMEEKNNGK